MKSESDQISANGHLRVPETLEEVLSPTWLTAALGRRFPGIEVTAATLGPVHEKTSTNARFRIECSGGVPDGLSPHLCAKGYFTGGPHPNAGEWEALFYREVAETVGVRTLRGVYADVHPVTRQGVVITEDVAVAGATFLDARSPFSPDQAAASLEQFAALHATTWNSPTIEGVQWLQPRVTWALRVRGLEEIRYNFEGPIGSGVPEEARDADRLIGALVALGEVASSSPSWSVLHGDAHIGNVLLDASGRPYLLDWQLVQRGPWYLDVGYHLVSALTVEDRQKHERDLLSHYLECLSSRGIPAPSWDEAWLGFRRGIVYGFFLWGITMMVDPSITSILLERLGTAVADHDCYQAIPSG